MLSTPETPVMIVCLLLLASLVFIFAFAWGNLVLQRHRQYKKFRDEVKPDCVAAFRSSFFVKIDLAKIFYLKANIPPNLRREKLKILRDLEDRFPSYQSLINSHNHLILETFFTDSELEILNVANG